MKSNLRILLLSKNVNLFKKIERNNDRDKEREKRKRLLKKGKRKYSTNFNFVKIYWREMKIKLKKIGIDVEIISSRGSDYQMYSKMTRHAPLKKTLNGWWIVVILLFGEKMISIYFRSWFHIFKIFSFFRMVIQNLVQTILNIRNNWYD